MIWVKLLRLSLLLRAHILYQYVNQAKKFLDMQISITTRPQTQSFTYRSFMIL